ncbi:MAG: TPR repeat protein [Enterobacterales bacterium]|jgi:TPR repeat protein
MLIKATKINSWKINRYPFFFNYFNVKEIKIMGLFKSLIFIQLVLTGYVQAVVNGTAVTNNDWRSVVHIEFIDPDNGRTSSCTGVILSEYYAITTASCVMHEETAKQASKVKVCIGNQKPFKGTNEHCISSSEIYSHHNFINGSGTLSSNNLAYIKFPKALNFKQLNIKPALVVTPKEFSKLANESNFPEITWVGFDAKNLTSLPKGNKQQGRVSNAEFDYDSLSINVKSTSIRPGNYYQGLASFIQNEQGQWKLIGLVSHSTADKVVTYYPEFNPCDEDPTPVNYPKPIMEVLSSITAYPIAACRMIGFLNLEGYDELACKVLLQRNIDWSKSIDDEDPKALRQMAVKLYSDNVSKTDAGVIYKLLYQAQQAGDKSAAILLSQLLLDDKLLSRDVEQARKYLDKLVSNNNPMASLMLAKLLLFPNNGTKIEHSTEAKDKSISQLLEFAGKAGIAEAQFLLARLYQLGVGVSENPSQSYHWFALAAQQGYADAQFELGMHWLDGRAVKKPYPEIGMFWINQAAAHGQIEAQNYLGLLKPN